MILFLLILFLPSQLALHFWPEWALVNGIRVDYLAPTVYVTDLMIFLLWLKNKTSPLSFPSPEFRRGVRGEVVLLIVLNIFFSLSPFVTIYKWLRVYEYFWLFRYVKDKCSVFNMQYSLSLAVLWTCVLAWWQFANQSSVGGLWYWLGERTFGLSTPGIAKISLAGQLVLRPYATLPHPNALAGFLLLAILLVKNKLVKILGLLTIPLTFSRAILFFLFPLVIVLPIGNPTSLSERWHLMRQSWALLAAYPLTGIGLGNFPRVSAINYQPVHNVFLLTLVELGLPLGLLLIWLIVRNLSHIKNFKLKMIYGLVFITGMVDHYWLTSQQNILLLVLYSAYVFKSLL